MALLALLRAFPENLDAVREALRQVSPERLIVEAKHHGLSALASHALKKAQTQLPEPWAAHLARDGLGMAGGTLRTKGLLLDALDILQGAGVEPILIKGYALGARLYPEPLLRPTSDVDVFIEDSEVARASAALIAHGFRPMEEAAEAYHREHHHHVTFGSAKGSVELHFRLMTGFDAELGGDAERGRSVRVDLEGRSVRVLGPEDEALYLAAHAANHLFARVSWLYDLKLLLQKTQMDWALIGRRAQEARLQGPVYVAFALAKRAVRAPVPEGFETFFNVGAWHRTLAHVAFSDRQLEESAWLTRKWPGFALTTALASTPASRARFLGHHTARGLRRRFAERFPRYVPYAWKG